MARSRHLFHVTIATMSRARDLLAGKGIQRDMLMHKTAAISLLRTSIMSNQTFVDEDMLLTMLFLAHLEDSLGEENARQIHRAQVERFIFQGSSSRAATHGEKFRGAFRQ